MTVNGVKAFKFALFHRIW